LQVPFGNLKKKSKSLYVALRGRIDKRKQATCGVARHFSLKLQDFYSFGVFFYLKSRLAFVLKPPAERHNNL
jgi:hypothetical protein